MAVTPKIQSFGKFGRLTPSIFFSKHIFTHPHDAQVARDGMVESRTLKRYSHLVALGATRFPFFRKHISRHPHDKNLRVRGQIKSPGEALSMFFRASRDPKGELQVWVVNGIRNDSNTFKNGPFNTKNDA